MSCSTTTCVSVLTPPGRGAVATLVVSGPLAVRVVTGMFHAVRGRAFDTLPLDQIAFGRWQSSEAGEEVVVCRRRHDRVEVHCHGGHVAAERIAQSLAAAGCRRIDWPQWIELTEPDPIRADALIALAGATTSRTAAVLLDQASGTLRAALDALTSELDAGQTDRTLARLDDLLALAGVGRHLVEPYRVVLAGPPNVGKSSLINALLGYARAIVHDAPGTTRDAVSELAALDGWGVQLTDTAGQRSGAAALEAAGIQLARRRLEQADLVVLVFDAQCQSPLDADHELLAAWPNALVVANKCDLLSAQPAPEWLQSALLVSAQKGTNVAELARRIVERLVPRPPRSGEPVPFAPAQVDALSRARDLLAAGQVVQALQCVRALDTRPSGEC